MSKKELYDYVKEGVSKVTKVFTYPSKKAKEHEELHDSYLKTELKPLEIEYTRYLTIGEIVDEISDEPNRRKKYKMLDEMKDVLEDTNNPSSDKFYDLIQDYENQIPEDMSDLRILAEQTADFYRKRIEEKGGEAPNKVTRTFWKVAKGARDAGVVGAVAYIAWKWISRK